MSYDCLLAYIRGNPDQLRIQIWSGIKLAIDAGEPVHQSLPRSLEEFEAQFKALISIGAIAVKDGRWRALEISNRPRGTQGKMF